MKKVDIIIPTYKAHAFLHRALGSILTQQNLEDIQVTIVNDCCPEGSYKDIIRHFSKFMDIKEIRLKENCGPGIARQKGLENTSAPYVTFLDADDCLGSPFTIVELAQGLDYDETQIVSMGTVAQHVGYDKNEQGREVPLLFRRDADFGWVHGKMYRRSALEERDIHFFNTRANEDSTFNTLLTIRYSDKGDCFATIEDDVYYWLERDGSITRRNGEQYTYDQALCGGIDGMIKIYELDKDKLETLDHLREVCNLYFLRIYDWYNMLIRQNTPEILIKQAWYYAKKYYHYIFQYTKDFTSQETYNEIYAQLKTEGNILTSAIPEIGFKEFLNNLKESEYNEDEIYDIWAEMPQSLKDENIQCGVCANNYDKKSS